jgi:hypothetical protein
MLLRALAEQLSVQSIRTGKNLEAIVIDMLKAGAKAMKLWQRAPGTAGV